MHDVEVSRQLGVHLLEDAPHAGLQVGHVVERPQRLAVGFHLGVPRPQPRQVQAGRLLRVDLAGQGHHLVLDRVMKRKAVGGCIIEAGQLLPFVGPEVGEAGVGRHLAAQRQHLAVEVVEGRAVRQVGVHHQPPRPLPFGTVAAEPAHAGLRDRLAHAVPVHGQAAHDLVEPILQLHQVAEDRHVFDAVDAGLGPEPAQQLDRIGRRRVLGERQQLVAQRLRADADARDDLFDQDLEAAVGFGVGRVFRECAVDLALRFVEHRRQVAPLLQPGAGVRRGQVRGQQGVHVRLDGVPVQGVEGWISHGDLLLASILAQNGLGCKRGTERGCDGL